MGGGGVSGAQKNQAASNLAGISSDALSNMRGQYGQFQNLQGQVTPFYQNRMQNGLPFYRNLTDYNAGNVAQAFAPARAQIYRQTGGYSNMPSGYRDALINSLNAQQARAFDSTLTQAQMMNEQAKQQAAAGLTGEQQLAGNMGLGMGQLGAGASQSLLYAPPKPTMLGTLGGMLGQGMSTVGQIGAGGGFAKGGAFNWNG